MMDLAQGRGDIESGLKMVLRVRSDGREVCDLCHGHQELRASIAQTFKQAEVDSIHIHSAKAGCYSAEVY